MQCRRHAQHRIGQRAGRADTGDRRDQRLPHGPETCVSGKHRGGERLSCQRRRKRHITVPVREIRGMSCAHGDEQRQGDHAGETFRVLTHKTLRLQIPNDDAPAHAWRASTDPQRGVLESQTQGRKIGVAPCRGGGGDPRGSPRWRASMRRYRRGNGPCRRWRSDRVRIRDFYPRDSSRRPSGHPPTGACHPARGSAGQRRATARHRRPVTRHGTVHRDRSRGQHHGTRPDLLTVPERYESQQQRDEMRMKSSTHHAVTILTLCELKRYRRGGRALPGHSVQLSTATRGVRALRCRPTGATVGFHSYRHPDSLTRGRASGDCSSPQGSYGCGPFPAVGIPCIACIWPIICSIISCIMSRRFCI